MKRIQSAVALLVAMTVSSANAESTILQQSEALKLIRETAKDFCNEAQTTGSSHEAKIKGSVEVKLGALVKKLGDGSASLAADYSQDSFVGVLRNQVLDSIKEANNCRKDVLELLIDRLLPINNKPKTVIENSKAYGSSPQDAYLIATHPTKVSVKDVSILSFRDDDAANFLTASLENQSEIPAQDVLIDLVNDKKGTPLTKASVIPVKKSNYYLVADPNGITIPAKSILDFPFISVAQLANLLGAKNDDYCLYDASPEPIDVIAKNAGFLESLEHMPPEIQGMQPATQQVGLRLRIKYQTIFKQTVTNYVMVFAHFTEKGSKGWIWYPSTKKAGPVQCISA